MQEGSSAAAVAPALGASSEPQKPPYAEAEAGASAGDVIAKETAWRLRLNRYNARYAAREFQPAERSTIGRRIPL